jgi:hypothetical protein
MPGPTFDPTHAVRFDLQRGSVIAGTHERQVVVGCAALDDLVLIAGSEAATAVGRTMGASIGERVAARLGGPDGVRHASIETVVSHLGGELSLTGFGVLTIERWGLAMVLLVERPAVRDMVFLASILEGAVEAATARPVRCLALGRDGRNVRVLLAGEGAITRAQAWLAEGVAWGDVLARLQPKDGGA